MIRQGISMSSILYDFNLRSIRRHFQRRATGMLFASVLALTSGCGSGNIAAVNGTVMLDGEPVDGGLIIFQPNEGQTAGAPIVNGKYSIAREPGAAVGVNQVKITWLRNTGKKWSPPPPVPAGTLVDEQKEAIPEIYNKKSTLSVELRRGRNEKDFHLESVATSGKR